MRSVPVSLAAAAWLLTSAVPIATRAPGADEWPLVVEPVASPAAADSGQPQLSVSARGVLLSWIERASGRSTLRFAERADGGWSAPRTVASGDDWFVNWADVPSVVRRDNGTLAAHFLQKSGADTYAYDVRLTWSKDGGTTWAPAFTPHHDGTKTEHGFASLLEMPDGGLGLVWLDGRAMKTGHGEQDAGDMSLRFATYRDDWKQTVDMPLDARVCECCPTAAAMTSAGPIVAYRDRGPEEVRDIYLTRLENGAWTKPEPVHADGWRINACPVNGPSLSARGRTVAIAWFTAVGDRPRAYAAFSTDAGRTFGAPIRLDETASLGRVDVEILPDGSAAASYVEFAAQKAEFRVRRIARDGAASRPITVAAIEGNRASGYPRMALHRDQLVFAWVAREGTNRVKTAAARLPD
jgi:hypothetical protein